MVEPNDDFKWALEFASDCDLVRLKYWFAKSARDINDTGTYHGDLENSETLLHAAAGGCDEYDQTPGQCETIRWLLLNGADVNKASGGDFGYSPLQCAAFQGNYNAAVVLLNAGARVNFCDNARRTPLIAAASCGRRDLIRTLLRRGASLDARAAFWGNAEDNARQLSYDETAALLAEIRAAGGWRAYVRAPRACLLAHRSLCEKGRAIAPAGTILERLFAPPPPPATARGTRKLLRSASLARTALPKEVFWHVLRFWRCDRDARD